MSCSLLETEVLSLKKERTISNYTDTLITTVISTAEQLIFFSQKSVYLQLWITEPWKYSAIFLSENTKIRANRRLLLIFYPSFLHQKTIQSWHLSFEHSLELRYCFSVTQRDKAIMIKDLLVFFPGYVADPCGRLALQAKIWKWESYSNNSKPSHLWSKNKKYQEFCLSNLCALKEWEDNVYISLLLWIRGLGS